MLPYGWYNVSVDLILLDTESLFLAHGMASIRMQHTHYITLRNHYVITQTT